MSDVVQGSLCNTVRVHYLSGEVVLAASLQPSDLHSLTVGRLKALLQAETGIPVEQQDLACGTDLLQDTLCLSELTCDEEQKTSLYLIRRRRQRLVSGHADHTMRLWDVKSLQPPRAMLEGHLEGHTHHVVCMAMDPAGRQLISGSRDGSISWWCLESCKMLSLKLVDDTIRVVCLDADWHSSQILSGHTDGIIRLWRFHDDIAEKSGCNHHESITCLAVNWTVLQAVTGTFESGLRVWDITSFECIHVFGNLRAIGCVVMNWEKMCALSGGGDGTLQMTEFHESERTINSLQGHYARVVCVDADWMSQRAVSAAWDGTVRLWDLEQKSLLRTFGESIKRQMGHAGTPSSLAVDWIGAVVISGHRNGCLRIWEFDGTEKNGEQLVQVQKTPVLCLAAAWDIESTPLQGLYRL